MSSSIDWPTCHPTRLRRSQWRWDHLRSGSTLAAVATISARIRAVVGDGIVHPEAMAWLRSQLAPFREEPVRVLELGSRDINGSPRALFKAPSRYLGVDLQAGVGVDVVADASDRSWAELVERMLGCFDVVICAEVFEHSPRWREICVTAHELLVEGGAFVGTAAGEGRAPHSAEDGRPLALWHGQDALHAADGSVVDPVACLSWMKGHVEHYENITQAALVEALEAAGFAEDDVVIGVQGHDIYWTAR